MAGTTNHLDKANTNLNMHTPDKLNSDGVKKDALTSWQNIQITSSSGFFIQLFYCYIPMFINFLNITQIELAFRREKQKLLKQNLFSPLSWLLNVASQVILWWLHSTTTDHRKLTPG